MVTKTAHIGGVGSFMEMVLPELRSEAILCKMGIASHHQIYSIWIELIRIGFEVGDWIEVEADPQLAIEAGEVKLQGTQSEIY